MTKHFKTTLIALGVVAVAAITYTLYKNTTKNDN